MSFIWICFFTGCSTVCVCLCPKRSNQECRHTCNDCYLHQRHGKRLLWAPNQPVMPTHPTSNPRRHNTCQGEKAVWGSALTVAATVHREISSFPEVILERLWQRLEFNSDTPILNQSYNHNRALSSGLRYLCRACISTITFYSIKSKHKHFRKRKSLEETRAHCIF